MRKTSSCKKTSESPGCSSSLTGLKKNFSWSIRSGQFNRLWNWVGKSNCPGARLDLTVNFHYGHFIDPTNCPWVSEDDSAHVVRMNDLKGDVAYFKFCILLLREILFFFKVSFGFESF